ncbi:MAG TPA: alpha/beta fold hydrolase, partial [Variovorax sp.]|nr:alpha/beta fold hydrolase [Variovorax sp.]
MSIQESVVTFGPDKTLVGILTEPAAEAGRARLGCLLLNTGVNHRIGPRRINVKTAQQLAGSGLPCMRFDMSGIGDSKASGGREGYREQQSADMRAALDQFQESTGISQFVVFGLCTGAVCALHLALADPRIVGVLMFDGYVFLTKATRIERKLRRGLAFPFNAALRSTNAKWRDWTGWLRSPFDAGARARLLSHFRK